MKKILVPVDFSTHSEYALEVAASLARRHKAVIVVLHMLGLSEAAFAEDEAQVEAEAGYYMKLAKKRFDTFLHQEYLKGIPITEIVQNYKIFDEIKHVASENNIDLIVMGSHGTSGIREIFVGSNTEKVVRKSDCPVLVVKKQMSDFNPGKVVYSMDFNKGGIEAYQRAMALFSSWKAEVHLVHVNQPNFQFMSSTQLRELSRMFFDKLPGRQNMENVHLAYVADYTVELGLYAYASEVQADLIAVTTHGRSGLSHFFRGSLGGDIVNHAPLPVITFTI